MKKIDISEIGEEFLYQCLIGHCRNNLWPNTTALARLFKILYITLPLDELNGCIEKCADTLSQEGHTDAVQSLVTALVDQVKIRLIEASFHIALCSGISTV